MSQLTIQEAFEIIPKVVYHLETYEPELVLLLFALPSFMFTVDPLFYSELFSC